MSAMQATDGYKVRTESLLRAYYQTDPNCETKGSIKKQTKVR